MPKEEKECCTILLHKGGERKSVGQWRPITIGTILMRLYAKCWDERLRRNVSTHVRQKALVPIDGCFENVKILQEIIKKRKRGRKELNLVFLDLAKAFDTILHKSIEKALLRKGVPEEVRKMVSDLYDGATASISTPVGETRKIQINSGVKQGCPLSPLLFNIVMNEMIERIEEMNCGIEVNGKKASVM